MMTNHSLMFYHIDIPFPYLYFPATKFIRITSIISDARTNTLTLQSESIRMSDILMIVHDSEHTI